MTGTATTVSLCNRALGQIGARSSVSSLNEGSTQSDACNLFFNSTFQNLARTARWACLRKQANLSLLAAAMGTPENPNGTTLPLPPTPFLYSYQYPSDCLAMRFIVPSFPSLATGVPQTTATVNSPTYLPGGGQIFFAIGYSVDNQNNPITVILTNQSQAQAVYTVNQPNPVIWDSLFEQAFVSSLAAFLVPALSLNLPLMQGSIASAEKLITAARVADANEGVTVVDHVPDWMRARWAGDGYGYVSQPWIYGGLIDMAWPC